MTIMQALALHRAGRLTEAEQAYLQILAAQPNDYHALHFLGVLRGQGGDMAGSIELISRSLALQDNNALAHFHLAEAQRQLGRRPEAVGHYRRTLELDTPFVPAYAGLAECLIALHRPEEALQWTDKGMALEAGNPDLLAWRGDALRELDRNSEAAQCYERALAAVPNHPIAVLGRVYLLLKQDLLDEAVAASEAAMAMAPDATEPLKARAIVLGETGRKDEAMAIYQMILAREPTSDFVYFQMGCLLQESGALPAALAAFDSALTISPDHSEALSNRAQVLAELGRTDEALADCRKALSLDPEAGVVAGKCFQSPARRCEWPGGRRRVESLATLLGAGLKLDPYMLALAVDDPEIHLAAARRWAAPAAPDAVRRPPPVGRLKVAYVSPDFNEHPVAHMTVEVFEAHDRSRFETCGICVKSGALTPIRRRMKGAFHEFIEAECLDDRALADLLRQRGIDIVVDLAGYTAGGRTKALRWRPVPVTVNWLGYPGTTGTTYIDYIIADPVIIPPGAERFYTEQVVRLPYSYMPRDSGLAVGPCPSRSELGLPDGAFVFSAFNNVIKFNPDVFAVWMRLLQKVEGSVLWLNCQNDVARLRLRQEAAARGVAPERLIFAARSEARADHLARLAAADLFLDTVPYGAHSTANDMLWRGVPVVTVCGEAFAARVAAGMLTALGLPELIAPDLAAYEDLALALARSPDRLNALRHRLQATGNTSPLFDVTGFCRSLETAYQTMAERARKGLQPQGFSVEMTAAGN